ncbi:MFS transporter [Rhodococcus sp. NPDC127528]|uniref:MFS transporter n=1 Tax=unclassified Rhodococcus (in: high G+C Gram-positive bacteria) TaxID=192944 RepID=UPI0036405802
MPDPDPTDGPVLVTVTYQVPADNTDAFLTAMRAVGRSRRRTGATRWAIYQDSATPGQFVEAFTVGSWSEHMRQHTDRVTGYDQQLLDTPRALADGQPDVRHLISPRMPPQVQPTDRSPSSG